MLAAALASALLLTLQTSRGERRQSSELLTRLDVLAADLGFGLDQIEVSGARLASDIEILDAIGLSDVRSFLTFDVTATRARIERLPWIDTVAIERQLPNRLQIAVTERRPFAAWDRGARDILIDATGRQLSTVARDSVPDLPRIAGEHAAEDAARFLNLVAAHPQVAQRFERAERVAGRRWRLHLRDDLRIELPADADAAALAMLVEPRDGGRLIDAAASVIDLTVLRRIVIRPTPPAKRS